MDILYSSDKFYVNIVQFSSEEGVLEYAAAKTLTSPKNTTKLWHELGLLRELHHFHVATVLGTVLRETQRGTGVSILVFPLTAQNLDRFLEDASCHNKDQEASRSKAWSVHPNIPEFLPYFAYLCKTVLYLHQRARPVKHRDIKPENILIERNGDVILADSDISKVYDGVGKAITYGTTEYTVMYAPEHVLKDPESTRRGLEWDTISLGFVFLEMATVAFGKSLDEMRAGMRSRYHGQMATVYSIALGDDRIKAWLDVHRTTAMKHPLRLPSRLLPNTYSQSRVLVSQRTLAVQGMA